MKRRTNEERVCVNRGERGFWLEAPGLYLWDDQAGPVIEAARALLRGAPGDPLLRVCLRDGGGSCTPLRARRRVG